MTAADARRRVFPAVFGLLAVLSVRPGAVAGQTADRVGPITGRVVDAATGLPLDGVLVRPEVGAAVLTTADGIFRLEGAVGPLAFQRLGYQPIAVPGPDAGAGEMITVPMQPDPLELPGLEVFIRGVEARFERRRNAASGLVQALELDDMLDLGVSNGYELFLKAVRNATPCPGRAIDYCLRVGGRSRAITVCIDDRRAWGGVDQLVDYRPDELYVVEIYRRGEVIRAYTRKWVRDGLRSRQLPPLEWGC